MSEVVQTEYGRVKGVRKMSAVDIEYISFYGIPYATPPVGELRFKDPQPPKKWSTVYDATEEKLGCCGVDSKIKKVVGTEDCLHLNIYTKNLRPNKPYPVMFYIYGGGFSTGSSSTMLYGPDFLLMSDVIVVICDYRLGCFGFTSFKDKSLNVPGNAALKDQRMALKFTKDNIHHFGGDPNNITLFGHSTGASSVNFHCVSEQSKGLFNRAILMSGSILNDIWLHQQNLPLRLALKLGYSGGDDDQGVFEFLQTADPIRMTEEQKNILEPGEQNFFGFSFGPLVEPYITSNTFISKNAIDSCRTAWGNDIDILIGGTTDEGLGNYKLFTPNFLASVKLEDAIPNELNLTNNDPKRIEFAERIRSYYYGTSEPTENMNAFCRWKGDLDFTHGLYRLIQSRQNSNGKGKTYLYRFAVDSPTHNLFRLQRNRPNIRGVLHADEVSYYFKHNYGPIPDRESMEFIAIQRFVSLMTSFATTGNPNDNVLKVDMQNVQWHPVDTKSPPYIGLNIDENLEFKILPEGERLQLWDDIFIETNTPLY